MCMSVCGAPGSLVYIFTYYLPKDPRGSGFTAHREEIDSLGKGMSRVLAVKCSPLSWGTLLRSDGELMASFGKPEH